MKIIISSVMLVATIMASGCGGDTVTDTAATGEQLTLTAPFTTMSGLNFSSSDSSSTPGTRSIRWMNNSTYDQFSVIHTITSTYQTLLILSYPAGGLSFTIGNGTAYQYGCVLSGSSPFFTTSCATMGITFNRNTGTISFSNTPVTQSTNTAPASGTMNGSLTFPSY